MGYSWGIFFANMGGGGGQTIPSSEAGRPTNELGALSQPVLANPRADRQHLSLNGLEQKWLRYKKRKGEEEQESQNPPKII